MRISMDPSDRDYSPLAAPFAQIYLDGKRLDACCVTADEEKGEALVYMRDEHGKLVTDGEMIRTEVLRGVVRIELEPR